MPPVRLILIGYRGTGKSAVGRVLAARLGVPFVDADAVLEEELGCTIAALFRTHDEAYFRDRETEVLQGILDDPALSAAVISTGGGIVIRSENRARLRRAGVVIHLTADAATIRERLQADPTTADRRPQLTGLSGLAEIEALLAQREPWYAECAAFQSNTVGRSPDDVAAGILSAVASLGAGVKAS